MFKIRQIEIENIQGIGLTPLIISNLNDVNVFIGKNNSSKTSTLEALRRFFSPNPQEGLALFTKSDGTTSEIALVRLAFEIDDQTVDNESSLTDEDKTFIKQYGRVVWYERNLKDVNPANFKYFDLVHNPPEGIENLTDLQAKIQTDTISRILTTKTQEYINKIQSERKLGVLFSDHERRTIDSANEAGQSIVQGWSLGKQNPSLKASIEEFQNEFPTLYKSFERFEFYTNNAPGAVTSSDLFSEIGKQSPGGVTTLQFKHEGLGERDTAVLAWLIFNPQLDVLLIDEPENSKHADLQRMIYKLLLEKSNQKQVFIFTHSPIFAQFNKKSSLYLLSKTNRDSETKITQILSPADFSYIRSELGLENSDLFFSKAILFVEGETEEKALAQIFKAMEHDLLENGIKIINVKGGANLDIQKLKEFLIFIKDIDIKPQIFADNDKGIKKIKNELTKEFKEILKNNQFVIWEKEFEDNFSDDVLFESLKKYIEKYGKEIDINIKTFSATRKKRYENNKKIMDYIENIFHRVTDLGLSKSEYGQILGLVVSEKILSTQPREETKIEKAIRNFLNFINQ